MLILNKGCWWHAHLPHLGPEPISGWSYVANEGVDDDLLCRIKMRMMRDMPPRWRAVALSCSNLKVCWFTARITASLLDAGCCCRCLDVAWSVSLCLCVCYNLELCKKAESITMPFRTLTCIGRRNHVLNGDTCGRHLANTIEQSVFSCDADGRCCRYLFCPLSLFP